MRGVAPILLLAACGSTPGPVAPVGQAPSVAIAAPPPPVAQPTKYRVLHLSVGTRSPAIRGAWDLTLDGDQGTLVMVVQEATGSFTVERADREAVWKTTETRVEKGPIRHTGERLDIDLEGTNESMQLRCWHRTMTVATAGARRVPTPTRPGDCDDPGIWIPATMTKVDALACGFGEGLDDGQVQGLDGTGPGGYIDETLIRFVATPGIEEVEVDDPCFHSSGLRVAK